MALLAYGYYRYRYRLERALLKVYARASAEHILWLLNGSFLASIVSIALQAARHRTKS